MAETQISSPLAALCGCQYLNLTTFRKDGTSVITPVWFALDAENQKVYLMSSVKKSGGKVKRIRNNPQVEVAPATISGKSLGPAIAAKARILSAEEELPARIHLNRKYGLLKALIDFGLTLRDTEYCFMEVVPA